MSKVTNPYSVEPVVQEKPQSAATPTVVDEIKNPVPVADTNSNDVVYGFEMEQLAFLDVGLNAIPEPPRFILEKLARQDLVWRWLSRPSIKQLGTRGYHVYVAPEDIRARIDRGEAGGTIYLSPEYYVCWREDALLGVTPRRLYEARRAEKSRRTIDQTKRARQAPGGLVQVAQRLGGRVADYTVEEWQQEGE